MIYQEKEQLNMNYLLLCVKMKLPFELMVDGTSMVPIFRPGDRIVVRSKDCVHYANLIYPSDSLKTIEELLKSERSCVLFDCFGLCDEERKKWNVPFIDRTENARGVLMKLLTEEDFKKINHNIKMM